MAIDIFLIAPFSDELERVFSGAKRTIPWSRHSLSAAAIEAVECLGHWIKQGLQWITVVTRGGGSTVVVWGIAITTS
jgi:hypothetical protein